MPFCVNCGQKVERDSTVCPNCRLSPWQLQETPEAAQIFEADEKLSKESPPANPAATIAVGVTFFAIFFLLGATFWQLGVFNVGQGSVVTTGWAKTQPLSASIAYTTDGYATATFQNTVGTTIKITQVYAQETVDGPVCTGVLVNGKKLPAQVKAGDGFEVVLKCPEKYEGDPFDLLITIEYAAVMGGISTDHTETGHIRGPAEGGNGYVPGLESAGSSGYKPQKEQIQEAQIQAAPYHVYKAFNFGSFLPIVAIIGTLIILYAANGIYRDILSKGILSPTIMILAMCGIVFIILANFIFIFGFHDLLTYRGSELWRTPTFTQQYGWIIETVVFGIIGFVLLFFSELLGKRLGAETSIYPLILRPLFLVFFFIAIAIAITGFNNFLYTYDYTNYRGNLAWGIETIVFGALCILSYSKLGAENKNWIGSLLNLVGAVLVLLFLFSYIPGVNATLWNFRPDNDLRWLAQSLVFACLAGFFLSKGGKLNIDAKGTFIPWVLNCVGVVLLSAAFFLIYLFTAHMFLYEYHVWINPSWVVELLFFVIPAVASLIISRELLRKKDPENKFVIQSTIAETLSSIFLFLSLIVYIFGVHGSTWSSSNNIDYRWAWEFILFLVPGILLLSPSYQNKKEKLRKIAEVLSFLFLFLTLITYLLGVHSNIWSSNEIDYRWAWEFMFFLVPTILFIAPSYQNKKEKILEIAEALSFLFLFLSLLVYILGVHSNIWSSNEIDYRWAKELILFLIPAILLLAPSFQVKDYVRIKSFAGSCSLLLGICALFAYVFGIVYSFDIGEFKSGRLLATLLETILFALPTAALIYYADKNKSQKEKSIKPSYYAPCGFLLLLGFSLAYLMGLMTPLSELTEKTPLILEAILFLAPGLVLLWKSDELNIQNGTKNSATADALDLMGAAFTLLTVVFVYILGLHSVFSHSNLDSDTLFLTIVKIGMLLVPALLFLVAAYLLKKKCSINNSFMPKTFEYSSYPLLISFTLVYLFGIYGFENKNLFWIAESLLFGIPGFYLLWKAQEITNKLGKKKSLLSKPLYIIGGLFVIATLISFIVGFNDFLYSENQTIGWLLEAIAYLLSAAASLYSADRLKKVN